ncbi:phasin family protein [Rhodoferax sp. WC2427]|uniref:phasin family protein n=1 Tax=Rhodoferax sp. WC2427 TaxID=3234144 RepID=UPI003467B6E2
MDKKTNPSDDDTPSGASPKPSVKDSAQQIWLAGLGAFAKAQEEGSKVFEALVKDGIGMQTKSQAMAEEKLAEAASKMTSMAQGITERATGQWDKLENIFEDRVAKALQRLGVPSAQDVAVLTARVDELSKLVQTLVAQQEPAAKAKRTTKPDA